MKISVFAIPEIKLGKVNVKDERLDAVDKITKAKKRTYVQVELVGEDDIHNADCILTLQGSQADLLLKDLEFVETRLSRAEQEAEKAVLGKLKEALEKEVFVSKAGLNQDEMRLIAGYSLFTLKPVVVAQRQDLDKLDALLSRALSESGYISFFTTGEKETRAWLIRRGINAWEAAGSIHSDIQRGFIRAEIIALGDFLQSGGESQARQAGKLRLENKDYVMQDTDLVNFRFNK